MFTVHSVSIFFHVLAAIIWVGGVTTLGILNARAAREKDPAAMASFTGRAGSSVRP